MHGTGIKIGGASELLSAQEISIYRYNRNYGIWQNTSSLKFVLHGPTMEEDTTYLYINEEQTLQDSIIRIRLYKENDTEFQEAYNIWIYTWSTKTDITSGDINIIGTIDNYDYTGENSYSNENNNISQQQQEEENRNWWKKQFDNMFSINSGDAEELQQNLESKLPLDTLADISGELAMFYYLTDNEPTDFVIKWENIDYSGEQIIKKGEINLSQTIRENETFTELLVTTRIIMSGILAWIFIHEVWRCFCIMVGIGTELYDDYQDEKDTLNIQKDEYEDTDTGQSYRQIRYSYGNWSRTKRYNTTKVKPRRRIGF